MPRTKLPKSWQILIAGNITTIIHYVFIYLVIYLSKWKANNITTKRNLPTPNVQEITTYYLLAKIWVACKLHVVNLQGLRYAFGSGSLPPPPPHSIPSHLPFNPLPPPLPSSPPPTQSPPIFLSIPSHLPFNPLPPPLPFSHLPTSHLPPPTSHLPPPTFHLPPPTF